MIEETERLRPRPVFKRYLRRLDCEEWGVPIAPPTDAEKEDAIRILQQGHLGQITSLLPDPMFSEAQRIMDESC